MNYISKCSQPQPPATVKQMMVPAEGPNPKLLEQAARELQMMRQAPMSNVDGVSIVVLPDDVQRRSQDLLSQAFQQMY